MTQPSLSVKPPSGRVGESESRAQLRKRLLDLRRSTGAEQRQQWDQQISERLIQWCRQERPASLGIYWPIQAEPDLRDSYPQLREMGIHLALPLVISKLQPLVFLQWEPGAPMSKDEYGIPVPQQRERQIQPEVLLIPCVGFNENNYRLGYGGGYYDRTLAVAPRPLAIGIAHHQAQSTFAAESHDVPMDLIFTEN